MLPALDWDIQQHGGYPLWKRFSIMVDSLLDPLPTRICLIVHIPKDNDRGELLVATCLLMQLTDNTENRI